MHFCKNLTYTSIFKINFFFNSRTNTTIHGILLDTFAGLELKDKAYVLKHSNLGLVVGSKTDLLILQFSKFVS